jgi:hypothetical protein
VSFIGFICLIYFVISTNNDIKTLKAQSTKQEILIKALYNAIDSNGTIDKKALSIINQPVNSEIRIEKGFK